MAILKPPDSNIRCKWSAILWAYRPFGAKAGKTLPMQLGSFTPRTVSFRWTPCVDALAERDVREALGMFARMLSSGHFNADRVIKIGVGGKADIKHDILIKILMRADYRIYSEEAGFIKNVFEPPKNGFTGNIFLAVEILGFFAQPQGDSVRIGGFRSFEELLSDMAGMGFGEDEVREQVHTLIKHKPMTARTPSFPRTATSSKSRRAASFTCAVCRTSSNTSRRLRSIYRSTITLSLAISQGCGRKRTAIPT